MLKKISIRITIVALLLTGTLLLLVSCAGIIQDAIFFHPRPSDPVEVAKYKEFEVELEHQGERLQGWYIPSTKKSSATKSSATKSPTTKSTATKSTATLFYYGGNAEEISQMISPLMKLGDHNFVLFNYRGYGSSTGKPGEVPFKEDAIFIFDWAVENYGISPENSFIIGRSLGTGVAVHTAALRDTAGVILVTPYDSLENVVLLAYASMHLPELPIKSTIKYPFRSIDYLSDIQEPGLILVAEDDNVIPRESTDALISAWTSPLESVILEGTQHNLIFTDEFYATAIQFIKDNLKIQKPAEGTWEPAQE